MTKSLYDFVCPICKEKFLPNDGTPWKCPHSEIEMLDWQAAEIERLN